jgi:hypothetical protein
MTDGIGGAGDHVLVTPKHRTKRRGQWLSLLNPGFRSTAPQTPRTRQGATGAPQRASSLPRCWTPKTTRRKDMAILTGSVVAVLFPQMYTHRGCAWHAAR